MKKNIVIIDDNYFIRSLIKLHLNELAEANNVEMGFYSSENGVEGLGFVYITTPDLIIIDTTLPKYSGKDLIHYLLSNPKFHLNKTKVIVLSEGEEKLKLPDGFTILNKKSKTFLPDLVDLVAKRFKFVVFKQEFKYSHSLIKLSNKSDVANNKRSSSNVIGKLFNMTKHVFYEVVISFLISFIFIVWGRKPDENITQEQVNQKLLKGKYYPTFITSLVIFILGIGLVGSLFLTQFGLFKSFQTNSAAVTYSLNYGIYDSHTTTAAPDYTYDSIIDGDYIYTGGRIEQNSYSSYSHLEKRKKSDGSIAAIDGGWSQTGAFGGYNAVQQIIPYGSEIVTVGNYNYSNWRIERRNKSDGALNWSYNDYITFHWEPWVYDMVIDGDDLYVAGREKLGPTTDQQLRLHKYDLTDTTSPRKLTYTRDFGTDYDLINNIFLIDSKIYIISRAGQKTNIAILNKDTFALIDEQDYNFASGLDFPNDAYSDGSYIYLVGTKESEGSYFMKINPSDLSADYIYEDTGWFSQIDYYGNFLYLLRHSAEGATVQIRRPSDGELLYEDTIATDLDGYRTMNVDQNKVYLFGVRNDSYWEWALESFDNIFENIFVIDSVGDNSDTNIGDHSCSNAPNPNTITLEQTVADTTGTGLSGEPSDPTWADGWIPDYSPNRVYGIEFDGVDDVLVSDGDFDIEPGGSGDDGATIEGWFKADDFDNTEARLIAKTGGTAEGDYTWMVSTKEVSSKMYLQFRLTTSSTTTLVASDGELTAGTWTHFATTYDGSEMRIYMNGVLVGSTAKTGEIDQNGDDIFMGRDETDVNQFDGIIDELRIWDHKRTQLEITDNMFSTVDADSSGLITYWNFDSGFGDVAVDLTKETEDIEFPGGSEDPAWVFGKELYDHRGFGTNYSLSFDRDDDLAYITDHSDFDFGDGENFSISMWLNLQNLDFSTDQVVLAKKVSDTFSNAGYMVYVDDDEELRLRVSDGDGTNMFTLIAGTAMDAVGWNHYTFVYDDSAESASKIYRNGSDDSATTSMNGTFANIGDLGNSESLVIGDNTGLTKPSGIIIDDLIIYDRAVNSTEASNIYSGIKVGSGVLGKWEFNEGSGQTIDDISGNSHTFTRGTDNTQEDEDPTWTPYRRTYTSTGKTFDGKDDYGYISDHSDFDFDDGDDFSISFWLNLKDIGQNEDEMAIITKRENDSDGASGFYVYWGDVKKEMRMRIGDGDGSNMMTMRSNKLVNNEGWHHFTFVYDDSSESASEFYVNGVADSGGNQMSGSFSGIGDIGNSEDITFGTDSTYDKNGTIQLDDIYFYDRAISATDAADIYDGTSIPSSGLIGAWDFEEGTGSVAADSSGNGHDISFGSDDTGYDSSDPYWISGYEKYDGPSYEPALHFDGSDDLVSLPNVVVAPGGSGDDGFTVEGWVNPDDFDEANMEFVSKANNTTAGNYAWMVGSYNSGAGDSGYGLRFRMQTDTDNQELTAPFGALVQNGWSHFSATYDGADMRLYLNGVLVDEQSITGTLDTTNRPFTLGVNPSAVRYLDGILDEVRIWDREKTVSEINDNIYKEVDSDATGLLAYWKLNEGTSQIVNDSTDNAYHGYIGTSSGSSDSLLLPTWTPLANELVLVSVATRDETLPITVTGNGYTFDEVQDVNNTNGEGGISLFRALSSTSPTAGQIEVEISGSSQPFSVSASRFSGVDASGTNGDVAIDSIDILEGPATPDNDVELLTNTINHDVWFISSLAHIGSTLSNPPGTDETAITLNQGTGTGADEITLSTWYEIADYAGTYQIGSVNNLDSSDNYSMITVGLQSAAAGECTLRAAIQEANANAGTDMLIFDISGDAPYIIEPQLDYPIITNPVKIIGESQRGASCSDSYVNVVVDGTSTSGDLLSLTADDSLISGLDLINGVDGIQLDNADRIEVKCNIIGLDYLGTTANANSGSGINITNGSDDVVIGGTADADRNIISRNVNGINIDNSDDIEVYGNFIGTDKTGSVYEGNSANGVLITDGNSITIGNSENVDRLTSCTGGCNLLTSSSAGIRINDISDTIDINNNYFNMDSTGESTFSSFYGVQIGHATNLDVTENLIGGTLVGVYMNPALTTEDSDTFLIDSNYVGTNKDTTIQKPNTYGIFAGGVATNSVDDVVVTNNIVSGNSSGITFSGENLTNIDIQSNKVGTDLSGFQSVPNSNAIVIQSVDNVNVGGAIVDEGNVIKNNLFNGVFIDAGSSNLIQNNTISENGGHGIHIDEELAVYSTDNVIIENSIYDNAGLGLNLNGGSEDIYGVTSNDGQDTDTGNNNLQNFPTLTRGVIGVSDTEVYGTFNSEPNTYYQLDFYANVLRDGSKFGEGKEYLGNEIVYTDGSGDYVFNSSGTKIVLTGILPSENHEVITSTATECTDSSCNTLLQTSEFSFGVVESLLVDTTSDFSDANPGDAFCSEAATSTGADITIEETVVGKSDGSASSTGNWHSARKTNEESTNSSNEVVYLTTDIEIDDPQETWLVMWSFLVEPNNTNRSAEVEAYVNGSAMYDAQREAETNTGKRNFRGFFIIEDASTDQTIDLTYEVGHGSGSVTANAATIVALRIDSGGLDAEYWYDTDDSDQDITSTSYTDIASVTVNPTTAGEYLVMGVFSGELDSESNSLMYRITHDGGGFIPDDISDEYSYEPTEDDDDDGHMIFRVADLSTGSQTFDFQARKESTNFEAKLTKLAVIRLEDVIDYYYDETLTDQIINSSSATTVESVSFTAKATEYAIMGESYVGNTSDRSATEIRMPDSTVATPHEYIRAKDTSDAISLGFMDVKSFSAGSETVELESLCTTCSATLKDRKVLVLESPTGVTDTSIVLPTWSPSTDDLILVAVSTRNEVGTITVSGHGLTFVEVSNIDNTNGEGGIALFRAMGNSPIPGSITVDLPSNNSPVAVSATRFANTDTAGTNGSGAIEAIYTDQGPATQNNDLKIGVTTLTDGAMHYAAAWHRESYLDDPPHAPEATIHVNQKGGNGTEQATVSTWYDLRNNPGSQDMGKNSDLDSSDDWAAIGLSIKREDLAEGLASCSLRAAIEEVNALAQPMEINFNIPGHDLLDPSSANLEGFWKFNDNTGQTAVDEAQGNDLTLGATTGVEATDPTWVSYVETDYALEFDGSDDYAFVSDDNNLDMGSYVTIEAWVNSDNLTGNHTIVSKGNYAGQDINYQLITYNDEINFSFSESGTNYFHTSSSANLQTGTWYHIAVTFDETTNQILMYLDGEEVYNGSDTHNMSGNNGNLYIGKNTFSEPWDGKITEVRVWDDIRTQYELIRNSITSGYRYITVGSALPNTTSEVIIDATTQPLTDCSTTDVKVIIDGDNLSGGEDGLNILADNSEVKGIGIINFPDDGIVTLGDYNIIQCNLLGLDPINDTPAGMVDHGYVPWGSRNNLIGGDEPSERNVISNSDFGIYLGGNSYDNTITGNYIGTDRTGTLDRGNNYGIGNWDGANNTFGGTTNVDPDGSCQGECNLISGNATGITGIGENAEVIGNFIGTDVTGTVQLDSAANNGIVLGNLNDVTIGGPTDNHRNIISGSLNGIWGSVTTEVNNLTIEGNYFGLGSDGDPISYTVQGNRGIQISTGADVNYFYSDLTVKNNKLAGHYWTEFYLEQVDSGEIIGNTTGVDASGTLITSGGRSGRNRFAGKNADSEFTIGGFGTDEENLFTNSYVDNLHFSGSAGASISVENNEIRDNTDVGVTVNGNDTVSLIGNTIYDNGDIGIDLAYNGVTTNDAGDGDTGANGLQNFPTVNSYQQIGDTLRIYGSLSSKASTLYRVEFFASTVADISGYGEGETYLGYKYITTDVTGVYDFSSSPIELDDTYIPNDELYVSATAQEDDEMTLDITGGAAWADFTDVVYSTGTSTIDIDGQLDRIEDDSSTLYTVDSGTFEIDATVNSNGILESGTYSLQGDLKLGVTTYCTGVLLSGNLKRIDPNATEMAFEIEDLSTSCAELNFFTSISDLGILVTNPNFVDTFTESFDNLVGGVPGTGTSDITLATLDDEGGFLGSSEFSPAVITSNIKGFDIALNSTGDRLYLLTKGADTDSDVYIVDTTTKTGIKSILDNANVGTVTPLALESLSDSRVGVVGSGGTEYRVYDVGSDTFSQCASVDLTDDAIDISASTNSLGSKYAYIATKESTSELKVHFGDTVSGSLYEVRGIFESEVFDSANANTIYNSISWDETLPPDSQLLVQVRAGDTADLSGYEWVGTDGTHSTYFTDANGQVMPEEIQGYRYIQYRVIFTSNQTVTPVIDAMRISYSN